MLFNATEILDICFGEGLNDEVYFCSLKENSLKQELTLRLGSK